MLKRLFGWLEGFVAYLVLLAATTCGVLGAPPWTIVVVAGSLSALTWGKRWAGLTTRTSEIDAEYRDLARLMWSHDWIEATRLFFCGRLVFVVVVVHMLHNLFFSTLAFLFGHVVAWVWGVR